MQFHGGKLTVAAAVAAAVAVIVAAATVAVISPVISAVIVAATVAATVAVTVAVTAPTILLLSLHRQFIKSHIQASAAHGNVNALVKLLSPQLYGYVCSQSGAGYNYH